MTVEAASGPTKPTGPTRRRGAVLERAIFTAVIEELRAVGFGRLTMEGIAARAHTGKAALYRRWACQKDLVLDAVHCLTPPVENPPDHGSVRADVLDLLRQMAGMFQRSDGCPLDALMCDPGQDEELLQEIRERFIEPRLELMLTVLRRGAERGQVRPESVNRLVAEVAPSLLLQRFLTHRATLTDSFLESVVDEVLMPLLAPAPAPEAIQPGEPAADRPALRAATG